MDVVARFDDGLTVLLPEVEPSSAGATVERLVEALAPSVLGAGFATFPADGADADTLLLAARQAATAARDGALESAELTVRRIALGDGARVALVADPAMANAFALLERLAHSTLPVLVLGETGVGKENAAHAVHDFSPRRSGPFISINCAGLPDSLLESELFGYERGAFSGATAPKPGLFEASHGGTVFLDEVGELSLAAQSRLLRVLETKTVTRLGSVKEKRLDLRVVAATHRELAAEVRAGRFREDLFFRLSAAVVHLPPLRERPREIAVLAREFVAEAARAAGREAPSLSVALVAHLVRHPWSGNVRELKNAMEFAVATATGASLEPRHLPPQFHATPAPEPPPEPERPAATFVPLAAEVRELERRRIKEALAAANGVQTRAAELIGMPRRTFLLRLRELRLTGEAE
jgi:DNA-binding NtrC family response regulator